MLHSGSGSVCEHKLTQDVKLYEHTFNSKTHIQVEHTDITFSRRLSRCSLHKLLEPLRVKKKKKT